MQYRQIFTDARPLPASARPARRGASYGRPAVVCLLVGFVLLTLLDGALPHAFGVLALLAAAALAFAAMASGDLLELPEPPTRNTESR